MILFGIYKLAENWALSWLQSPIESKASVAVKLLLQHLPILTWVLAAIGLIWITKKVARFEEPVSSEQLAKLPKGAKQDDNINRPSAIAFPLAISVIYQRDEILVDCSVAFYSLIRTKESPTELILRVPRSGSREICHLKLPRPPEMVESEKWAWLPYRSVISLSERSNLLEAIKQTMQNVPVKGPVFVEVEVTLPTGSALAMHADSRVQFWLPAGNGGPHVEIVEIKNWQEGVPQKWRLEQEKKVMFTDPDKQWYYEDLDAMSDDEQRRLMGERPDVWQAFLRETSDRMGPPGRPGEPWKG